MSKRRSGGFGGAVVASMKVGEGKRGQSTVSVEYHIG